MFKNRISSFVATFLIVGFFFLALPEKGYSQDGCCEIGMPADSCIDTSVGGCNFLGGVFIPGATCDDEEFGSCIALITDVPTLSEWGLIAMAGILGLVGYMVIRRRKVAA